MDFKTVRFVSIGAASASWLSTPTMRDNDACVCILLLIHAAYMSSGTTVAADLTLPIFAQLSAALYSTLVDM